MDEIKQMAKTVAQCIKGDTKKTKGYDTAATVKRIDGGTAYVSIPAGVPETPVKKTIDAKVGDTVQVHVENGTAWLVGNQTAPPTDDAEALVAKAVAKVADQNAAKAKTTADEAQQTANAVSGIANTALSQAQEAKQIADDTEQHFWFTETGTDTGAHITEVTQEEWSDPSDPNYQSGGNLLARSNGMAIRDGLDELATFNADSVQIGKTDDYNLQLYNSFLYFNTGSKTWGYLRQISDSITELDGISLMSNTAGNGNGYAYVDVSRGTNKSQVDIVASVHGSTYARVLLQKTSAGATVDITAKQGINFNTDTSTFTGDITASGDVTASGDITGANIGAKNWVAPSAVSCQSGKWYKVAEVTLDPGIWLIDCNALFPNTNATGTRQIRVTTATFTNGTTTAPASYGNITNDVIVGAATAQYPQSHFPVDISSETTFRLAAYQGSNTTMSVTGRMYATRIK